MVFDKVKAADNPAQKKGGRRILPYEGESPYLSNLLELDILVGEIRYGLKG